MQQCMNMNKNYHEAIFSNVETSNCCICSELNGVMNNEVTVAQSNIAYLLNVASTSSLVMTKVLRLSTNILELMESVSVLFVMLLILLELLVRIFLLTGGTGTTCKNIEMCTSSENGFKYTLFHNTLKMD